MTDPTSYDGLAERDDETSHASLWPEPPLDGVPEVPLDGDAAPMLHAGDCAAMLATSDLRARMEEIRRREPETSIAITPPRYDAEFFEGVRWLESLAGEPVPMGDTR